MLTNFRLLKSVILVLIAISTPSIRAESDSQPKPNILFIAVDDLRPELGCYGVDTIQSPHIDRLAASGVRFDRAYCQLAVCNPSRVSLLTGLRPDSAKVWTLDVRFRHTVPDVVTLPQHFKDNGYYAAGFGKIFHNPWPDNVSWSEPHEWPKSKLWSDEAKQNLADFKEQMRADGKSDAAINRLRAAATEIVDIPDHEHIDGAIAQQSLEAMRRLAKGDQPFFLATGFVRPHLPFVVPRKYWELYDREAIPLAENPSIPIDSPAYAMNTMYELRDYMDYLGTSDPRQGPLTKAQQKELKHGYYASVSLIDAQVGLLLDELESLGIADNTLVVLWGDHGWKLGEHNSWCKQSNYEIDARVPLIIRDPRAKANGQASASLVEFVDVYPTLCDLAGIPTAAHAEGTTLSSLLNDPSATVKDAAISQFPRRTDKGELMGYAMRTDRYRYIEWIDRKTQKPVDYELYDHQTDPVESKNLAGLPKHKSLLKELNQQLWETLPKPPPFQKQERAGTPNRPKLTLQNDHSTALNVYWVSPEGKRKLVGTMEPGERMVQNSTKGHKFEVESTTQAYRKPIKITQAESTLVISAASLKAKSKPDKTKPDKTKQATTSPDKRPNILFLMGDDWSYPHAGALGDRTVKTPTFDRLAREGVLFDNSFVSAPSCTPSRHSVSSGQYHWRLKDGVDLGGSIPAETPVYPDLLAETGYLTGFSRKGTGPSKHTYRGNDPFGERFQTFEEFYAERDKNKPFCFWYGSGEPHRPYDWEVSKRNGMDLKGIRVPACLPDNETVRTDLGDYYTKVERFDSDSARMLALLEQSGELDNTIVVMTGDNGMPFPRCKATLYDFGTRVPLVIRWGNKVKGGRTIEDFVSLTDLAPTFLEAVGLPVPREMTGKSLVPLLFSDKQGNIDADRDHVLTGMERHVYPYPSRAIRTEDFLYIRNFAPGGWPSGRVSGPEPVFDFVKTPWPTSQGAFSHNVDPGPAKQWMRRYAESGDHAELYRLAFGQRSHDELYNLKKDPDQLVNLADDPDYQADRRKLSIRLAQGLRESKDPRFSLPHHSTFQVNGWTIHLSDAQWDDAPAATGRMLNLLELQLSRVAAVIPAKALTHLKSVPIWINRPYPGKRAGAEYHPDKSWLKKEGRDPNLAKGVEITNTQIFPFENRRMPYLLLHELSHAYHDQVLGFNHPEVNAAFEKACDSKTYDEVKRFNGRSTELDKAYAMTNSKEYFAEVTEAFFGKNDYFPFTRDDLEKHDPTACEMLEKVWGVPKKANPPASANNR